MPTRVTHRQKYSALVCDKDGTLLKGSTLTDHTRRALSRFRKSRRWLILATGETIEQLARFDDLKQFDLVIAENGAVLFDPKIQQTKVLAKRWSPQLIQRLRNKGVEPHTIGEVVISTRPPDDQVLAQSIKELGLDWSVIQNRDERMALPIGTDKSSGLLAALRELGMSSDQVVGIGDAQNDLSLLQSCGLGVAVGSSVESLKRQADLVLETGAGEAVAELIDLILANELPEPRPRSQTQAG